MSQEEAKPYSLSAYWRILRENRNFRLLWSAQVISEMGDWLYAVAIYSLLLELTGQAKSVAFAIVLQLLPQVVIAPAAGVLNDRLSRRTVMIFADVVRVFIILAMLLVRSADMVWLIYVLLLLETFMWALFEPGRSALVPNVCKNGNEVLVANALSSTTWAVNLAVGSGIGGLLAWKFGREAVFVINACSFVVSALCLFAMRIKETHAAHLPPFRAPDLVDFRPVMEGVRYVKRDLRLVATMSVKAGMGLMGAHWVILPVFGERVFPIQTSLGHAGALSMSLLFASRGIGALLGSFSSGYISRNDPKRMRVGIFWAFLIGAAAYFALAGAPTLATAAVAVALGHFGTSMAWVFSTTMLQQMTSDRFRGRVFSADFAGLFLTMSAVSFLSGVLIDWGISVRAISFATGVAGVAVGCAWLYAQKSWKDPAH